MKDSKTTGTVDIRQQMRIDELELLVAELKHDQDERDKLDFPWTGNLGHWYWNVQTNNVRFNPLKVEALGFRRDELPGLVPYQFFTERLHPDDYRPVMDNMLAHLNGTASVYEVEYRIRAKDGTWKWFYDRGKLTRHGPDGRPALVAGIVFDISAKKALEEQLNEKNRMLEELARFDGLTDLFNSRTIKEQLDIEIRRARRWEQGLVIAMLDVDKFKTINDTYGHLAGDEVLAAVGREFKKGIRETDAAGRYGGDEFLLIFPQTPPGIAAHIIDRILAAIRDADPVPGFPVNLSCGVAQFTDQSPTDFLGLADAALYADKQRRAK